MKILPSSLSGTIDVISSKSISHRYVLGASLSNGVSIIDNILESEDLTATTEAVTALGAVRDKNIITGPNKLKYNGDVIDCNESGSTLRFMIPISLLLDEEVTLTGRGRLGIRPQTVYEDLFKNKYLFKHEEDNYLPLTLKGPLKGGKYIVDGSISSQFITGLLYALPLCNEDSEIIVNNELESIGYVNLTLDALKKFNIEIRHTFDEKTNKNHKFKIRGKQKYIPANLKVEGDFSQAAFWIVAALLNNKPLTLSNLNFNSKQGDMDIINVIDRMGANYLINEDKIIIYPNKLKPTLIDLKQIPDLGPILMVLASKTDGLTTFINTERLAIKESDRVQAMYEALKEVGVSIEIEGNKVFINGDSTKVIHTNKVLSSHADHRIAMAISILALTSKEGLTIDNYKCVSKSYPTFFEELKKIGGNFNV